MNWYFTGEKRRILRKEYLVSTVSTLSAKSVVVDRFCVKINIQDDSHRRPKSYYACNY